MTSELDQANLNQISEVSREDILKQLFGDVGEIVDDFTCAVESTVLVHGRMYITKKFICFYSNLFGLEKKIRIPYAHIKSVTKEMTAKVIPNAIQILTDKKVYIFRSFWDRDACYQMITTFINKMQGLHAPETSAPRLVLPPEETLEEAAANLPTEQRNRAASVRRQSVKISPTASSVSVNDTSPRAESVRTERSDTDGCGDMDTESGFKPSTPSSDDKSATKEEHLAAFEQESQKSRLKISVVNGTLPISVADFYNLYVSETAPFGIKQYHETVKDTNLVLTPWAELSSSLGCGREMKFFKPVNLPGLACTRGVKIQRYRRFEDYALIVCSSTRLEDVPCADTFSVDDMIAVKALEDGSVGVSVEITFQVTFIKSTMMKYIIDRSTNVEMNKWLEVFFAHLKKTSQLFKEGKVSLVNSATGTATATTTGVSSSTTTTTTETITMTAETEKASVSTTDTTTTSKTVAIAAPEVASASSGHKDMGKLMFIVLVVLFVVLFMYNRSQWRTLNAKMDTITGKVDGLEKLLSALLMERGK